MAQNFFKIRNGINLGSLSADPGSASAGDFYYNTTSNTLRWYNGTTWADVGSGGGGSSNTASSFIDDVAARTATQRSGGAGFSGDTIYDAYYTGFINGITQQKAILLDAYTSGTTTIKLVMNALPVNTADFYTDASTGWSLGGQGGTLGTSASSKVGANAISFNKSGTAGLTGFISRTTSIPYVGNNTKHLFWVFVPTPAGGGTVTNVFVQIGTTSANFSQFNLTTTESGGGITTNAYNLFSVDVAGTPSSTTGTPWTTTTTPTWYAVGVTVSTNATTLTGILIDGVFFGDSTSLGVQPGMELTIYNTSTKDNFILDSSNTKINGTLTMAASVGNSYAATNTATFIQRSTLSIAANNFFGQMPQSSYGGTTAEERVVIPLNTAASSSNIEGFVDVNTGYFFPVITVNAGVSIVVAAGSDIHTYYQSGCTLDIFQTIGDSNGNPFYKQRTGQTYVSTGAATNSSGNITIPMTNTTNIVVGDYVAKRVADLQISTTASGVNESFSSMTLSRVEVINPIVVIPDPSHIYGYYTLSNDLTNKIANTIGSNMTVTGTVVQTNGNYFNGHSSSGSFTTSNFINLPNAQNLSGNATDTPSGMAISLWFRLGGGINGCLICFDGNTTAGHTIQVNTSNQVFLNHASTTDIISSAVTTNTWHHLYYYINSSTPTASMYIDGAFIGSSAVAYASPGAISGELGVTGQGVNALTNGFLADVVAWRSGPILTQQQILTLYNNGIPPVLLSGQAIRQRYLTTGVTASQLEAKATVTQVTASEVTNLRQFAVGRRS
jgi:hypothetical protein